VYDEKGSVFTSGQPQEENKKKNGALTLFSPKRKGQCQRVGYDEALELQRRCCNTRSPRKGGDVFCSKGRERPLGDPAVPFAEK